MLDIYKLVTRCGHIAPLKVTEMRKKLINLKNGDLIALL